MEKLLALTWADAESCIIPDGACTGCNALLARIKELADNQDKGTGWRKHLDKKKQELEQKAAVGSKRKADALDMSAQPCVGEESHGGQGTSGGSATAGSSVQPLQHSFGNASSDGSSETDPNDHVSLNDIYQLYSSSEIQLSPIDREEPSAYHTRLQRLRSDLGKLTVRLNSILDEKIPIDSDQAKQMSDKEMKEFVVRSIAALPLPALLDDHPRERAAVQLLLGQQRAASDTLMLGADDLVDVLIYCCSPNAAPLPQGAVEASAVAACCERARLRPAIESGDAAKLRELIVRHRPRVVHVICHADAQHRRTGERTLALTTVIEPRQAA